MLAARMYLLLSGAHVAEVAQVKEFSQAELRAWMTTNGNNVSPWFGVMEKGILYK
jgi:hypothetical protein